MEEKDSQSNSQNQRPEREFSQEQYDLLKRCSEKKDITEWNKWFKDHPTEKILLQGAKLVDANLQLAILPGANLQGANLHRVKLQGALVIDANLKEALLELADLQHTILDSANLKGADLNMANLQEASLCGTNLQDAWLSRADLQGANLQGVKLQGAFLTEVDLQGADIKESYIQNTDFTSADLRSADFSRSIVDGSTLIWNCKIDKKTKFEGVGLDSMRIYPATKQLLEYNIRRMNWEEWYEKHSKLKWLVRPFWLMSDYGMSTKWIVFTFFGLALVFANIYYHWARLAPPGLVENLLVDRNGVDVQWWLVPLRTLYFSIVTQTTLGFGDMYARAQSICGHILLSLQVILGYVLLGALVTRFAVLFTAGGPAGEFTEKEQKSEQRQ